MGRRAFPLVLAGVFAVTLAAGAILLIRPSCSCAPAPRTSAADPAPPAAPAPSASPASIALAATFSVHALGGEEAPAVGTAFRDAATGLIVTTAHVVGEAEAVMLVDRNGHRAEARVAARDAIKDIAALTGGPDGPGLLVATEDRLIPGDEVLAVGAPLGLGHSVTRGIVSALGREIDARSPYPAIQHDAALNPGSSGGPLVDRAGRAVGLNAAMPDGFRRNVGIGYAIPGSVVARFLADVAAGRPVGTRTIGLVARSIEGELARALGNPAGSGVLVEEIALGEAADRAGLRAGDVIVGAAGRKVGRAFDLTLAVDAVGIDRPVPLTVRRAGTELTLNLPPAPSSVVTPFAALTPDGRAAPLAAGRPDAAGLGLAFASSGSELAEPDAGTPAAAAGIRAGDTVLAVGTDPVASADDARTRVAARPAATAVLLLRGADGSTRYVLVDPARTPGDGVGARGNVRPRDSIGF
ncbi:S1C family serine protease [Prosthecomicrobium hirschii]|uniref:S1C family serine protease n=1 Tax=Prosthecodimorpha hirschii TaxID=665126 RepID=UPI00221E8293|nr:trypsin-like peptidase domain-containing protein [Prosthecomicrobium hirschii]MCW1839238.1 trypsin-like peptidase domain-containing protein [Prosthecomicrobium hirschii]